MKTMSRVWTENFRHRALRCLAKFVVTIDHEYFSQEMNKIRTDLNFVGIVRQQIVVFIKFC